MQHEWVVGTDVSLKEVQRRCHFQTEVVSDVRVYIKKLLCLEGQMKHTVYVKRKSTSACHKR
jgi:hypothetical protein